MKLVRKELVENCLPSAPEYRYLFSESWTAEAIGELRRLGRLDYYADFPRPFFRLRTPEGAQLRGVQGEPTCRVVFPGGAARASDDFDARLARLLAGVRTEQGGPEWE